MQILQLGDNYVLNWSWIIARILMLADSFCHMLCFLGKGTNVPAMCVCIHTSIQHTEKVMEYHIGHFLYKNVTLAKNRCHVSWTYVRLHTFLHFCQKYIQK